MRFDDINELERLLKEAVEHRVEIISAAKLRERETAGQHHWALVKAVSVLTLPGLVLYLALLSQLDPTQVVITTRVALSLLFGIGG